MNVLRGTAGMPILSLFLALTIFFSCVPDASPAGNSAAVTTLGILRFQSSHTVPDNVRTSVEQFVYSEFTGQSRFRVLERSRLDAIQAERVVQETNNVINPTALRNLGAQYVVLGEVTRAEVGQISGTRGAVAYHATIAYGLRIIDVSTGSVTYSQDFSSGRGNPLAHMFSGFTGDVSTPAGAIDVALQETRHDLDDFISRAFSISGQIVSVESRDDKGVPRTVLVSLGTADGVDKRTDLNAYTSQTLQVNGTNLVRKKPIAELKFVESQGDHLSLFKVRNASPDLTTATGGGVTVFVEIAH